MKPIFMIDNSVTFATTYIDERSSEALKITPESMVTDFGMLIPTSADGFMILDFLEKGPHEPIPRFRSTRALLITSQGCVYWLTMMNDRLPQENLDINRVHDPKISESSLYTNRIPYGKGVRRVFGPATKFTNIGFLCMEMRKDIGDVLEFYENGMGDVKTTWETYNIEDIVDYLKNNRPSLPLPCSWSKTVLENIPTDGDSIDSPALPS